MNWEVILSGEKDILSELGTALDGHDPSIDQTDKGFVLKSSAFTSITDPQEVRDAAGLIAERLSTVARVLLSSSRPIQVQQVEHIDAAGTRTVLVHVAPATLRITARLGAIVIRGPDGQIVEEHRPADPTPKWLALAASNDNVAKALRLRNVAPLQWSDLYRLYELIEAAAGGVNEIATRGWATPTQIRRFKHTANSVAAIGDQSRHGVETTAPPSDPMKLSEAQRLVDELLKKWIDSQ